jgi:guanylate kinase
VSYAPRYRYWIVNDDLQAAIGRMRAVITAEECRAEILQTPPLEPEDLI